MQNLRKTPEWWDLDYLLADLVEWDVEDLASGWDLDGLAEWDIGDLDGLAEWDLEDLAGLGE